MRILHTADWHLGDRLGRIDRTADLRAAVERVAALVREEGANVLIVAGDLFSELARPDTLRESVKHWNDVFTPFLRGGGTILAVTGNHDNETFCQTLRHAMTLASPVGGDAGDVVPPGRLYLAAEPAFLRLKDGGGKPPVQFVLMPYPNASRYLKGEKYSSPEEKNGLISAAFSRTLHGFTLDATQPAVLVAHVQVTGADLGRGLFRLSPNDDVSVDAISVADRFCYVALGHVHKPQAVAGKQHVRYSGSIERMDLGEQTDAKSCVVFDVPAAGAFAEPKVLPLPSTRIYDVAVTHPGADLPRLKAEDAGPADLVNLHVRYAAGRDSLDDVLGELDAIFPRWYARDWTETGELGPTVVGENASPPAGFAATVREYLNAELASHPVAERDQILARADDLLALFEAP